MLLIRRMNLHDVEEVHQIELSIFSLPWSLQDFKDEIKNPRSRYFVAEEEGVILGYCGLWDLFNEGHITNIAVKPTEQGKGLGTFMIKTMMSEGLKDGINAFTLEVRASNAVAIHIYEKLGFVEEGRRKGFYEKPREDGIIMWYREII